MKDKDLRKDVIFFLCDSHYPFLYAILFCYACTQNMGWSSNQPQDTAARFKLIMFCNFDCMFRTSYLVCLSERIYLLLLGSGSMW